MTEIKLDNIQKIVGTNCYNCKFVSDKEEMLYSEEINGEGGIDPKSGEEMERAKKADLITLPGGSKAEAENKKFCKHEEIKMFVTARMCCAYWDNSAVKRPWKN
jgi:hypothetical protein